MAYTGFGCLLDRNKSMISARTIKCCVIDARRSNNYFHMLIIIQKSVVEGKDINFAASSLLYWS